MPKNIYQDNTLKIYGAFYEGQFRQKFILLRSIPASEFTVWRVNKNIMRIFIVVPFLSMMSHKIKKDSINVNDILMDDVQ